MDGTITNPQVYESSEADETVPVGVRHPRHFLFLSAPFGPFARELAGLLEKNGAQCTRVVMNGGDMLDWGRASATYFFGPFEDWRKWLSALIVDGRVTDVVSYGDSSPYFAAAVALIQEFGLRMHVFEQGYFRPDWVTLERSGVNANSRLPRDPQWYKAQYVEQSLHAAAPVGKTTPSAIARIVIHHLAMYAGVPFFPRYRAPYHHSAARQAWGHVWRAAGMVLSRQARRRQQERLLASGRRLYLTLLQRPGDSQLWRHSDFERVEAFLDKVITSFAVNAPKDALLLVRPHPYDHGLNPPARVLETIAAREGVADRVYHVDYGKLHEILPAMSGAVCVNSTAGLAAVEFGCPTIVLGRAMYDMPGLTHQSGLESFWHHGEAPDASLYTAFRNVVMGLTQINGAYATKRGRALAVPEAARRLLALDGRGASV